MCYRCSVCNDVVPHNTPLLKHVIYREVNGTLIEWYRGKAIHSMRKEVAREMPVCEECGNELRFVSLESLLRRNFRPRIKGTPASVPLSAFVPKEAPPSRYMHLGETLG